MPRTLPHFLALAMALAPLFEQAASGQSSPDTAAESSPLQPTSDLEAAAISVEITVEGSGPVAGLGVVLQPAAFQPPIDGAALVRLAAVQLEIPQGSPPARVGAIAGVRRLHLGYRDAKRNQRRRGTVLRYDDASQIAIIQFNDIFPYRLDGSVPVGGTNVAAALNLPGDAAALRRASTSGTELQFADAAPETSPCICLDDRGSLAGFGVRQGDGGWRYSSFSLPAIDTSPPGFTPNFDPAAPTKPGLIHEYDVPVALPGTLSDPLSGVAAFHVLYQDARQGSTATTTAGAWRKSHAPLPAEKSSQARYADGAMQFHLPNLGTQPSSNQRQLEVQLIGRDQRDDIVYASPVFGAVVERKGAATYVRLLGLPQSTSAAAAPLAAAGAPATPGPAAGPMELTSEVPLNHGVPALGGTDVLFRATGAPHWKRLSLKHRQWVKFPETLDLSKLELAGNRDALFALNRETGEIQKFNPATLEKQKSHVLPGGKEYLAISAGAASATAPIAVITSKGILAVSPDTLEPLGTGVVGTSSMIGWNPGMMSQSSGDGFSVYLSSVSRFSNTTDEARFTYQGPTLGFVADVSRPSDLVACSSSLIRWKREPARFQLPDAPQEVEPAPAKEPNRPGWAVPFTTAPLYLTVRADPRASSGAETTYTAYLGSYYSTEPLFSFPMPEAVQLRQKSYRIFLEPASFTLAVWSHETGVTLRTLDPQSLKVITPLLLNAPEPVAKAGMTYSFTPQVLGPAGWKLSAAGNPGGPKVDDQGNLRWVAAGTPGQTSGILKLHLTPAPGTANAPASSGGIDMRFPLLVEGAEASKAPVTAITAAFSVPDALNLIQRSASGTRPAVPLVPIESRIVRSEKRILDVLPGLNAYVLVRLEDQSFELRSPEDGKVLGNYAPPKTLLVLPAGDCLFTFDSINQTIQRVELPSMNVTKTAPLPGGGSLLGLGAGRTPEGPVSVVTSRVSLQAGVPTGAPMPPNTLSLLDRQTLAPGAWATFSPPPRVATKPGIHDPLRSLLETGASVFEISQGRLPPVIPTSRDGRILYLASGQIITSPGLTTGIPAETSGVQSIRPGWRTLAAPLGDRISHDSKLHVGKTAVRTPFSDCEFSPCGLYYAQQAPGDKSAEITLFSSDGMRPLFHITNIDTYRLPDGVTGNLARRVVPMGDKNLIIAIHRMGYDMQFIKLDMPAAYQQTNPQSAIVTSRISPFVAEGRTMQYQLTTNNPGAVSGFKLRQPVAGATLTREGFFTYKAPGQLKEPLALQIVVEVLLQSGSAVEHEFPIWVVPLPQPLKKGI